MPHKNPVKAAESKRAYYLTHRDIFLDRSTARRLRIQAEKKAEKALLPKVVQQRFCPGCGIDTTNVYLVNKGSRCKSCVAIYQKIYREANGERIAASKKQWAIDNAEYKAEQDKLYAQQHPEKRTVARNKWVASNPGENNAAKRKNKIARTKRVPSWLTEDDRWMIAQAYELADLRTKLFGFAWHVDHIIPLNGKRVSGLHVPENLQVIPWLENLRKGNRMEVHNG